MNNNNGEDYISIRNHIRQTPQMTKFKWFQIYKKLTEKLVYEFQDIVDWEVVFYIPRSMEFIRKFLDKVDWKTISRYQKLLTSFIRDFHDEVDWVLISEYQVLPSNFIREFQDKVDWTHISRYQRLSEGFIGEFKDKIDWKLISQYQILSENFIKDFQDRVDWKLISHYQTFTEEFIREYRDKVDWIWIVAGRSTKFKLSPDFIVEFQDEFDNAHFLLHAECEYTPDFVYWEYDWEWEHKNEIVYLEND